MLDLLLDPNVAYLFLVITALLTMLSLITPGTGVFELGALFSFVLAGWQISQLAVNWWALAILVLGFFPFIFALRRSGNRWYLVTAVSALVIGSIFLFKGEGWRPAVNPGIATIVSLLSGSFVWVVVSKTLEAHLVQPNHDLGPLIGATGIAKTDIHEEGTVFVKMEDWSAYSKNPIQAGESIRVISREGLILQVESIQPE